MEKYSIIMAGILAATLLSSVYTSSNAFALSATELGNNAAAHSMSQDSNGNGRGNDDRDDDENEKKDKGKTIAITKGKVNIQIRVHADDDDDDYKDNYCISESINRNLKISGNKDARFFDCDINGNVDIEDSKVMIEDSNIDGNVDIEDSRVKITNSNIDGNIYSEDSTLIIQATEVNGNVHVEDGSIELLDTVIHGNLKCDDVSESFIHGTTVNGNIEGCHLSDGALFPADFLIKADNGLAVERVGGSSHSLDVSIEFEAFTVRLAGNNMKVEVDGTITLDNKEYVLSDGRGIIIFFKSPGKQFHSGIMHITGKILDDDNRLQKFHLRAFLLPPKSNETDQEGRWAFVVTPAAKLGPNIRLFHLLGELTQVSGGIPPSVKKLDHFTVSNITSPVTAGALFNVTVTARDADGNVLNGYSGTANVTDLTGTVTPKTLPNFVNGVFSGKLNITKAMDSNKVTFTDVATGKKGTSNAFDVEAGALARVDLTPSNAVIQPSQKASFTAKMGDKFNNELPAAGHEFGWSLSSAEFGSIETSGSKANFTASSSVTTETNVTLTVTVESFSDSSVITIQSADHFVIGNISSPKVAGVAIPLTITAVTTNGTTVTSYNKEIEITDTTGTIVLLNNSGFSSGVWTGSVNITKAAAGVQIKVNEKDLPSKNGTSNAFDVKAAALDHFNISGIGDTQIAGAAFEFNVTAIDAYGNIVKDYNGTVTLSTNVGASPAGNASELSPSPYTFTSGDQGVHEFAAKLYNATENAMIMASDGTKTGSSNSFDVVADALANVSISPVDVSVSPRQNVTFTAQATDPFGNPVENAAFNWTLSPSSLGTLNSTTGSIVQFTATQSATETLTGQLTVTSGSESAAAEIEVVVQP